MNMPACTVIVQLMGGLGNQMFQYAAGRALSLRLGAQLKLDLAWFSNIRNTTPRPYALDIFHLSPAIASPEECLKLQYLPESLLNKVIRRLLFNRPRSESPAFVREPYFHYWDGIESISGDCYLLGYWQSEKYFLQFKDIICKDFSFPPLPNELSNTISEQIKNTENSVAIHVRRGDYVSNAVIQANVHGICSKDYYYTALQRIASQSSGKVHLFLFSDDLLWVRDNFDTQGFPYTLVDIQRPEEAFHDMHLMSLCRHHITANSSFSWWGAWLAKKEGITCAPAKWFNVDKYDTKDLYPKRWIKIG